MVSRDTLSRVVLIKRLFARKGFAKSPFPPRDKQPHVNAAVCFSFSKIATQTQRHLCYRRLMCRGRYFIAIFLVLLFSSSSRGNLVRCADIIGEMEKIARLLRAGQLNSVEAATRLEQLARGLETVTEKVTIKEISFFSSVPGIRTGKTPLSSPRARSQRPQSQRHFYGGGSSRICDWPTSGGVSQSRNSL